MLKYVEVLRREKERAYFDLVIGSCLFGDPQNVLLTQQIEVAFKLSSSFQ